MNLADAEKEFRLREYVWAKSEWEREINESFPHMRMHRAGNIWKIYQFMQGLIKEEQLAFARGRLVKGYREEAAKCGDSLSVKEESLCKEFDAFSDVRRNFQVFQQWCKAGEISGANVVFDLTCAPAARTLFGIDSTDRRFLSSELEKSLGSIPLSWEEQVQAKKQAGEKIKFISKKKLQKILTQKVKDTFGNEYVECQIDEGHWTSFDIKCGGWMLETQFNFGGKPGYQQSRMGYWHSICSQKKSLRPAIPDYGIPEHMYPIAHLCRGVTWPCSWEWELLMEEDVEMACEETFKYCRRFFEAAPNLLKGLDVEGISENLP